MARHKIYMIKSTVPNGLYWSNDNGWVDKDSAALFTEMDKQTKNLPIDGEWEVLKTIPKPKIAPDFYMLVEGFIDKHEGTDRVSQQFEHLSTRLKHSSPEYAASFAALPKAITDVAMLFAYKLLQQS